MVPLIKQSSKLKNVGDIHSLLHLKNIAWTCIFLQYWGAIIYLFCSLVIPDSHDIAVGCGILAICISLAPVVYVFLHKKFILLLSCISAFNIAPIWFLYLESVLPGYEAYTYINPALRMEALFWIALFIIFTNIIYIIFWRSISQISIKIFSFLEVVNPKTISYQWATILCFILPLIAYYFVYQSLDLVWLSLTAGRMNENADIIKEFLGTKQGLLIPINSVWQLTPLLGTITFISSEKKWQLFPVLCFGLGLVVCFFAFLSGTRSNMMFVIAPILFFIFYYNWDRGPKFWVVVTAILFVLIGVMEIQQRFRGNLLDVITNPAQAAHERGLDSVTTFDPTKSQRDSNLYLLCLMIQGYPAKYGYKGFSDLFTILVNPIPRAIWPDKPILYGAEELDKQAAFILDGPIFMGTTSLSFSIVGDGYQAGGTIGLFVYALFYGLFLLFFDGVIYYTHRSRPISVGLLGSGAFLGFWGFRALFALTSFSYPTIMFILFLKLVQVFRYNTNHVLVT